jgi:hypothetical protein
LGISAALFAGGGSLKRGGAYKHASLGPGGGGVTSSAVGITSAPATFGASKPAGTSSGATCLILQFKSGSPHRAQDRLLVGGGHFDQGQAQRAADQSHSGNRPFYGDGVCFDKQISMQRLQQGIERTGGGEIARKSCRASLMHAARRDVRRHRDHALAAQGD